MTLIHSDERQASPGGSSGDAATALLQTRIRPVSAAAASQVLRSPVLDQVCGAGAAVRLVTVMAPAGFGKTTAMAQCHARFQAMEVDTAWLTLDRGDNDVALFLKSLNTAVAPMLARQPDPARPLDVLARLAAHDRPCVLFLDEFEVIHDPSVLSLVGEVIGHLPLGCKVVIGSRHLPQMANVRLSRLRANRQLLEIDAASLRFSLPETDEFFRLHQRGRLPHAALSELHRKTEGWAATLSLAAMAIEMRPRDAEVFIARLSGSDRAVSDFLADEVIAQQPREIRDFLLRTSILGELNGSVCRALCPGDNCERILQQLDDANLFVTPVAGVDRSWRYHGLFAGFLQAQLLRGQPEEFVRLQRAASGWYEEHGRLEPAIDHALEGGDRARALALLAPLAEDLLAQGRMWLLARWFAAIPADELRARPRLQMTAIWTACFTEGAWEAMRRLEASGCLASPDPDVRDHVNALQPVLLAMQDRETEAYRASMESLARLPTGKPFADSTLLNSMAFVLLTLGKLDETHRLADGARQAMGGSAFGRIYAESVAALIDLEQGRLRQAMARFRIGLDSARGISLDLTPGNAWNGIQYAAALFETNELEEAARLLNIYLPLARTMNLAELSITSYRLRSRLCFIAGDIDQAFEALSELEHMGHDRDLPRLVASARLERSRVLLLQGHLQAARQELERAEDPGLWERIAQRHFPAHDLENLPIARLRHDLASGQAHAALPRIERAIADSRASGRHRRELKLKVLHSLAFWQTGNPGAAVDSLLQALRPASREGFMRLILDEGPVAGALVRRCGQALRSASPGRQDPILFEHVQRLEAALGPDLLDGEPPAAMPDGLPLEEPSRREIQVLKMAEQGYSNDAIAEKLHLSNSTVRTHLRNVNRKLNASNRTHAVAIARQLKLLD